MAEGITRMICWNWRNWDWPETMGEGEDGDDKIGEVCRCRRGERGGAERWMDNIRYMIRPVGVQCGEHTHTHTCNAGW